MLPQEIIEIQPVSGKKIIFLSDIHLGMYPQQRSREREKIVVRFLEDKAKEASAVFLLGDVFDFWYDYKKVAPRGFVRFLGALAKIADSGIPVYYFVGNHDVWVFDYLPEEIGLKLFRAPAMLCKAGNKNLIIGHGDIVDNDPGYRFLRSAFHSKFLQWCFSRLHPNFAFFLGHTWSKHSRLAKGVSVDFLGEEKEFQFRYARKVLKSRNDIDYFIFGHRHWPIDYPLTKKTHLINLGEWIHSMTYAEFDGETVSLKSYAKEIGLD